MTRPLLVGMAPARRDREGKTPFVETASGRNLARYVGVEEEQLPAIFSMVNLIPRCLGGERWPETEARRRALALWRMVIVPLEYQRVILLGNPVARAFGMRVHPLLEWRTHAVDGWVMPTMWATCPHPSGLVRFWNDPASRERAGLFLREAAMESAL